MKYVIWGFMGAVKLFIGLLALTVLVPFTAAGLVAGLIHCGFTVGFDSAETFIEWLAESSEP